VSGYIMLVYDRPGQAGLCQVRLCLAMVGQVQSFSIR